MGVNWLTLWELSACRLDLIGHVLSIPLCPIYPISPLMLESVTRFTILERVSDFAPRALGITLRVLGWKNRQLEFNSLGI